MCNLAQLGALACICDSNAAALQEQGVLYPNVRLTDDYQSVLDDGEIRAVVIAAPAAQHFDLVKRALLAGKDVFVEKPLALRYAQGREQVEWPHN